MSKRHHIDIAGLRASDRRGRGRWTLLALLVAASVAVASCGGDDDESSDPAPERTDAADAAEDIASSLEQTQDRQGGGFAKLVVGNQVWTFDSVLCAFGEEQIGQEGAEFNLSSIQDGLQMYATVDKFGHSLSLNDIEDFENPSVDLSSVGDGFIVVDGKAVTAEADFIDGTTDAGATVQGSFAASCP